MDSIDTTEDTQEKTGFIILIRRLWTHFLVYNSYAFTISALFINIVIIASIMWPADGFLAFEIHASELGILTGTSIYVIAVSGILFGTLADRISRIKLMAFVEFIYGLGL
ncbi:MAG: hypothetical protein ACFFE5_04135, partial [Candidatus Thorarchaeota archaeon]